MKTQGIAITKQTHFNRIKNRYRSYSLLLFMFLFLFVSFSSNLLADGGHFSEQFNNGSGWTTSPTLNDSQYLEGEIWLWYQNDPGLGSQFKYTTDNWATTQYDPFWDTGTVSGNNRKFHNVGSSIGPFANGTTLKIQMESWGSWWGDNGCGGNCFTPVYTINVTDDDTTAPTAVKETGTGANQGPIRILLNGVDKRARGTGTVSKEFDFTDAELASISGANKLTFKFAVWDASGIARNASGSSSTDMNYDIGNHSSLQDIYATYVSGSSAAATSSGTAKWSVFEHSSPFTGDEITFLLTNNIVAGPTRGRNDIRLSVPDDDYDVNNSADRSWIVDERWGYMSVTDDDTDAPTIGTPTFPATAAEDETIEVTVSMSDATSDVDGSTATLWYGYNSPYAEASVARDGTTNGDGTYTFTIPLQGGKAGQTLKFYLVCDDDDSDRTDDAEEGINNNSGSYFSISITAASVVVDTVDYTAGNLGGKSGGAGWTGAWTDVDAGFGIDVGNNQTQGKCSTTPDGGRILGTIETGGENKSKRSFGAFTSGEVFMTYLMKFEYGHSGAVNNGKFAGVSLLDAGVEKAFVGAVDGDLTPNGNLPLAADVGGTKTYTAFDMNENNDYQVFAKYDFAADTLQIKTFKVADGFILNEEFFDYEWEATITNVSIAKIDGIQVAMGATSGGPGDVYFDEIRIGTNWHQVVLCGGSQDEDITGPTPTLLYVGTDLESSPSNKTWVYDYEVTNTATPLDIAVSWTDPSGVFMTNDCSGCNTNFSGNTGRVVPNWDPLSVGAATNAFNLDKLFTTFNGNNGDITVTTEVFNAFSITNLDLTLEYFVTVSGEDNDNDDCTTTPVDPAWDDIECDRAITVNSQLVFTVVDDDTTAPVISNVDIPLIDGVRSEGTTDLDEGDIAIVGFNFDNDDQFTFVALETIQEATVIKFTDRGWIGTQLRTSAEGRIEWTAPAGGVTPGTMITITFDGTEASTDVGSADEIGTFSLAATGDQLLAYQGDNTVPSDFLFAVNSEGTGWQTGSNSTSESDLPPGLTDGVNAIALSEIDNAKYDMSPSNDTKANLLAAISSTGNWTGSNATRQSLPPTGTFTVTNTDPAPRFLTDELVNTGGWQVVALVQDVDSGINIDGTPGDDWVFPPHFDIFISDGLETVDNSTFDADQPADGGAKASAEGVESSSMSGIGKMDVELGIYTAKVYAADNDIEGIGDAHSATAEYTFTVEDDDDEAPNISSIGVDDTSANAVHACDLFISQYVEGSSFNKYLEIYNGTGGDVDLSTYYVTLYYNGATTPSGVDNPFNLNGAYGGSSILPDGKSLIIAHTSADLWDGTPHYTHGQLNFTGNDAITLSNTTEVVDQLGTIGDASVYAQDVTLLRSTTNYCGDTTYTPGNWTTLAQDNLTGFGGHSGPITDGGLVSGGISLAGLIQDYSGVVGGTSDPDRPLYSVKNAEATEVLSNQGFATTPADGGATTSEDLIDSFAALTTNDIAVLGDYTITVTARDKDDDRHDAGDNNIDDLAVTNIITVTVIDDDTNMPTAVASLTVNNPNWTNDPNYVLTFTGATDASGIGDYRRTTDNPATEPTDFSNSASHGTSTTINFTQTTQGELTNYVYAVDADYDRPDDFMKGSNAMFVVKYDVTAPAKVTGEGTAEGADPTSQMELSWTPLPDGGDLGTPLSPWRSYEIFYTDDGTDPTTASSKYGSGDYSDLGTNTSGSVTLNDLVFGTLYTFRIRGTDTAGNVGPLSDPIQYLMPGFNCTQGVTTITTEWPKLWWKTSTNAQGHVNQEYDLIYADYDRYNGTFLAPSWALIGTGYTNRMEDTGAHAGGSPWALGEGVMRFYRAAIHDQWLSSRSTRLAAEEVYFSLGMRVYEGENWIQMPGIQDDHLRTLKWVLGIYLPQGATAATATRVSWYNRTAGQTAYKQAYLSTAAGGTWTYVVGGAGVADDALLPQDEGFIVELPAGSPQQLIKYTGRVPTNSQEQVIKSGQSYNLVSYRLPTPAHPSDLGLLEAGFTGGFWAPMSDMMWKYNRANQRVDDVMYYSTIYNEWRFVYVDAAVPADYIKPDDGLVIYTMVSTADWTWTNAPPYVIPEKEIQ